MPQQVRDQALFSAGSAAGMSSLQVLAHS